MQESERKLHIEWELIDKAARDKDFLAALAFCIITKANYNNSKIYHWTWKKLIGLCHCNLNRIKKATREAFDNGLIYEEGKGLVCSTFRKTKGAKCAVLHINYDDNGSPYVYIKSNYKKSKRKAKAQTISDIEDVILSLGLLHGIGAYSNTLNTWLRNVNERKKLQQIADVNRGVWRDNYDIIDYSDQSSDPFKRGYSLDKILKNVFKNSISLYKLSKLIKSMRKNGILKVWNNYYKFAEFNYDEDGRIDRGLNFKQVTINHQTNQVAKRRSIYIEKTKSNEDRVIYYRRMANGYMCTADYSHFKKNWKLINSKQNAA